MSDAHTHVGALDRTPSDRSRKLVFLINDRPSAPFRMGSSLGRAGGAAAERHGH